MVAHYLAQFLQPSCTLLPKTETGVSQFTPADVLCHFNKKGGFLHTLTELFLSVILPDFYFIPLGSTTSLLKIFSVYLVIFFSSSSHSFTIDREEISSQKDSLTCTLRPQPPLPITCLRKPSFLSKILHFIVGTSNAMSAAMLEKCLGYFRILFTNSAWKASNFATRSSVRMCVDLLVCAYLFIDHRCIIFFLWFKIFAVANMLLVYF